MITKITRNSLAALICALLLAFVTAIPTAALAQEPSYTPPQTEKARVLSIESVQIRNVPGTEVPAEYQTLRAELLSGERTGSIISVENDYLSLSPGDTFFLTHSINTLGESVYTVLEPNRLPALGILFALFVLAVVLIGGWTGLRGLAALGVSILLVFYALLPGISAGYDPVLVAAVVCGLIVVFGSYLTHGVSRTTSAAVIGLLATVTITALLAHFSVRAARLSGFSDESAVYLNFASNGQIDFVGLLLGSMLVAALGILYDAAIGQAVAVEELLRAAPKMPVRRLFLRAMRIGREHIGALVNTLAIAYVGVALPLLLLFQTYGGESFLETINREIFATEIVRGIVGSFGIILAVPISTLAAIFLLTRRPPPPHEEGEVTHTHSH